MSVKEDQRGEQCQRLKREVDCEILHRLKRRTSASENVGPRREVDCEIPHRLRERNEAFFIRVWKPLPSQHVLKTLRGSPKAKAQRRQYGTISSGRGLLQQNNFVVDSSTYVISRERKEISLENLADDIGLTLIANDQVLRNTSNTYQFIVQLQACIIGCSQVRQMKTCPKLQMHSVMKIMKWMHSFI